MCDSSQSISDALRGHADIAWVGVAVDDARRATAESRPCCPASDDALWRHRAEVDFRPRLGVQEIGRRSPARSLGPAAREPVKLAERIGDATPVGFAPGRSPLHVGHHHQTVSEVPSVRGRDLHRHCHSFTVEVSQQVGLPREIGVAATAETTDRKLPVDAHALHLIDSNSASERFDSSDVVTPLLECLPSHRCYCGEETAERQVFSILLRQAWQSQSPA
jgi:hypothetical protein